ncbi:hypothetical protein ACFVAV_20165 [Nocardia sp. NPDC057663]
MGVFDDDCDEFAAVAGSEFDALARDEDAPLPIGSSASPSRTSGSGISSA